MKIAGLLISLLYSCLLPAQVPADYYSGTAGLEGFTLKSTLHQIISTPTISWNYADLPAFYQLTDRDLYYEADSSLLDIYSELPASADPYNYVYEDSSQLISGAETEGMGWNREHLFSQSFFYGHYPMYSDLHFVVPADARVNQRRSNLPFGQVSNPNFTSLNGSKVGLNTTAGYTLSVFEPIDEFKGDIARALFYVAVRYESLLPFFQTENSRNPFEARQEIALRSWMIPLLKQWHIQDPVSAKEINRNEQIFQIQGNRNPFIDHPEWVTQIWELPAGNNEVPDPPIYLTVVDKGSRFVSLEWFTESDNVPMGFEIYRDDTLMAVSKEARFVATGLQAAHSYQFSVKAYDQYYNWSPLSAPVEVVTRASDTFAADLLFTKYIEGTGNNKALELKNLTGYTVDLRHYSIGIRQYNQDADVLYWTDHQYRMEGSLEHGAVVVLLHPESNLTCISADSVRFVTAATPLNFDGWLAIDLRKDAVTIDRIGYPYEYASFAENVSLYRKDSVQQPNAAFNPSEWNTYPIDYCLGLGVPSDNNPIAEVGSVEKERELYPNPVRDNKVFVSGTNLQTCRYAVLMSVQGQFLKRWEQPFLQVNYLNLPPDLPKGIYLLKIENKVFKFMLQ